jgi:nondiscriminating aspartyl-tRNA synthetase
MNGDQVRSSRTISAQDFDKEVVVKGWVQEVRNLGGISFLILRDRSGTVQITAPKKKVSAELMAALSGIPRESVVSIKGVVKASNQVKMGYEIIPIELEVLSVAQSPLPMGVVDKVSVEMDTRFNHRFMDLRKPETRAVFEIKSLALELLDGYMKSKGFVETFTPKIVASGAEGGASLFEIKYFDKRAYLAQSPQLYKQMMMSTGLDRVYEIGPAFRAELSDTVRHVSEFISFDAEMAFIDGQRDVMDIMEGVTHHIFKGVAERGKEHLERLGAEIKVPRLPYPVMTYSEALDLVCQGGVPLKEGDDLGTEGEKLLGDIMKEKGFDMYWFVEYPEDAKPFYIMEKDGTPYSYSFDLDYKGQEMASGGQREHRYDRLVQRMVKKGLDPKDFEFYLNPFAYGMPPHGGFGLGIERLIVKMLDQPNIREAILFPRDRNRLVP